MENSIINYYYYNYHALFDFRVTKLLTNLEASRGNQQQRFLENWGKWKEATISTRALEVENGNFTPLVFETNAAMGVQCTVFLKTLAGKNGESYAIVIYICSYIPSVKKVSPQNGGFIRAKLTRPRIFCYKNNVRKIQNGGFII